MKTDTITSAAATTQTVEALPVQQESKWSKQHTLISSKAAVDYDNLTAIEAVSMTAVLVLAVIVGALTTIV